MPTDWTVFCESKEISNFEIHFSPVLKVQAGYDISVTVTYGMSLVTPHQSDISQHVHKTYRSAQIHTNKRIPSIFNDESTGTFICLRRHIYMSHVLLLCISFLDVLVVIY
jgi:hypothetical protein